MNLKSFLAGKNAPKTVMFSNHSLELLRFDQGGSSGGENVDCSGLDLVHLDDIITDMRIGNFIRVRTNGQPRNIKLSDITGMNLANNKLTDGDNLKDFLSYLPRNGFIWRIFSIIIHLMEVNSRFFEYLRNGKLRNFGYRKYLVNIKSICQAFGQCIICIVYTGVTESNLGFTLPCQKL